MRQPALENVYDCNPTPYIPDSIDLNPMRARRRRPFSSFTGICGWRPAESTCPPRFRHLQEPHGGRSNLQLQFHRHSRLDIALVKNFPLALVFLPAADIPTFVGEGRVDLGITGRDQVAEHDAVTPPTDKTGVEEVMDLGFGRCKLQVQVPEKGPITKPEELVGNSGATCTRTCCFTLLSFVVCTAESIAQHAYGECFCRER